MVGSSVLTVLKGGGRFSLPGARPASLWRGLGGEGRSWPRARNKRFAGGNYRTEKEKKIRGGVGVREKAMEREGRKRSGRDENRGMVGE